MTNNARIDRSEYIVEYWICSQERCIIEID